MNLIKKTFLLFVFGLFADLSCQSSMAQTTTSQTIVAAERFAQYHAQIKGKRLGLIVNQTSIVNQAHLVDYLLDREQDIKIIFTPEHGFRGDKGAGEEVASQRDASTGIKIVSIYGQTKKPTKQNLKNIDLLVFDIQDVGVRYYTYISTMHYVMQACAENEIPLLILDRPNPNGDYIDGPVLKPQFKSFVGMHEIPLVHGLTVAELAQMINGEGWLSEGKQCELKIVKVKNYDHSMRYSLPIKPSPNLPNDLAIRLYPSLGFFEATNVSVGRGTDFPFQVLGYLDAKMGDFKFKARSITGSWSQLNHAGKSLYGERFTEVPAGGISLESFYQWHKKFELAGIQFITRPDFLDKLVGQSEFRQQIESGMNPSDIKASWNADLQKFNKLRQRYLLYPDHADVLRYSH